MTRHVFICGPDMHRWTYHKLIPFVITAPNSFKLTFLERRYREVISQYSKYGHSLQKLVIYYVQKLILQSLLQSLTIWLCFNIATEAGTSGSQLGALLEKEYIPLYLQSFTKSRIKDWHPGMEYPIPILSWSIQYPSCHGVSKVHLFVHGLFTYVRNMQYELYRSYTSTQKGAI